MWLRKITILTLFHPNPCIRTGDVFLTLPPPTLICHGGPSGSWPSPCPRAASSVGCGSWGRSWCHQSISLPGKIWMENRRIFVLWTRELVNQFLKNHQLNKAEIGMTDESISDWISGSQDTSSSICSSYFHLMALHQRKFAVVIFKIIILKIVLWH